MGIIRLTHLCTVNLVIYVYSRIIVFTHHLLTSIENLKRQAKDVQIVFVVNRPVFIPITSYFKKNLRENYNLQVYSLC